MAPDKGPYMISCLLPGPSCDLRGVSSFHRHDCNTCCHMVELSTRMQESGPSPHQCREDSQGFGTRILRHIGPSSDMPSVGQGALKVKVMINCSGFLCWYLGSSSFWGSSRGGRAVLVCGVSLTQRLLRLQAHHEHCS